MRVLCTIPIHEEGPVVVMSGRRYARLPDGRLLSETFDDDAEVQRLCTIPGYTVAGDRLDPAEVEAADQAIDLDRAAERENMRPGLGPQGIEIERDLEEQRANNRALAADYAAAQGRIMELEKKLAQSEVPRLTTEIEALRRQVNEAGGAPVALENENKRLREANDLLAQENANLKAGRQPKNAVEKENASLREQLAALQAKLEAGGGTGAQA